MKRTTHTERRIIQMLFYEHAATRSEIAERLKIREGTVGKICAKLLKTQAIEEDVSDRKRKIPLRLKAKRYIGLGVDHNAGALRLLATDSTGTDIYQTTIAVPEKTQGLQRKQFIAQTISDTLNQKPLKNLVLGIGFCDIGMFDVHTGHSVYSAWLPGWENIPLRQALEEKTGLPVTLLTKTEAACLAEHTFNANRKNETAVFITVDRGIGMSVIREGELWRGNTPVSGELGHLIVDINGAICGCGRRGCLETIAGGDAIVKKVRLNLLAEEAEIWRLHSSHSGLEQIILAAKRGHKLSILAIREAAEALGKAVAHALMILGIGKVVYIGQLTQAGDLFAAPLEATLRKQCLEPLSQMLSINPGKTATNSFAKGAAYAALERHFLGDSENYPRAICQRLFPKQAQF